MNSAGADDYVSPATTSSVGTRERKTPKPSKPSPAKPDPRTQRAANAQLAQRGRRAIVNSLELLMPALDDLPTADALKACCEIMRRISDKAAKLSVINLNENLHQMAFPLLEADSA